MYYYISWHFVGIIQIIYFTNLLLTLKEWFIAEKLLKMLCKKSFPLLLK